MPPPKHKNFSVTARRSMVRNLMALCLPISVIEAAIGSVQSSDYAYFKELGTESSLSANDPIGRTRLCYKAALRHYAEIEHGRAEECPGLRKALADHLDIPRCRHACSVIVSMFRTLRGSAAHYGYRLLLTSLFGDGHFLPDLTGPELLSAYITAIRNGEPAPGNHAEMIDSLSSWTIRHYGEGNNALPVTDKAVRHIDDEILSCLPAQLRLVITMRFGLTTNQPVSLEVIGAHLGVTREHIRQLEVKAIRMLRFPATRQFMAMLALPVSKVTDEIIDREMWRVRANRLDRDLYFLGLPPSVLSFLQTGGIRTLGQLQRTPEPDLIRLWMQMPESRTAPARTLERMLVELKSVLAGVNLSIAREGRYELLSSRGQDAGQTPFSEFWTRQSTVGIYRAIDLYWQIADVGLVPRGENPFGEKLAQVDLIDYVALNAVLDFRQDRTDGKCSQLADEYFYRYLPIILSPFAGADTVARVDEAVRLRAETATTLLDGLAGKLHLSRLNDAEVMVSAAVQPSSGVSGPACQRLVLAVWELFNFDASSLMTPAEELNAAA